MQIAIDDTACVDTSAISWGKGSRAERCLCDTSVGCSATAGVGLGNNGYDRFSFGIAPHHTTPYHTTPLSTTPHH